MTADIEMYIVFFWNFSSRFLYNQSVLESFFFSRHLDDEEEISIVVHKHWLMGIKSLFWPSIIFIGVWSILALAPNKTMAYGVALAAMFVLIWWIRNFMDYYLDAWVITDKGIIDLAWHGWFHRSSSRVLYSDLQGVSYEINGIFGTLFGYGQMEIEKISTGTTIAMDYVKDPKTVESVILENMEDYLHAKNLKDATTVQGILAEFVAGSLQKQSAEEQNSRHQKLKVKK